MNEQTQTLQGPPAATETYQCCRREPSDAAASPRLSRGGCFSAPVVKSGASDLHAKSGQPPRVRINGVLRTVDREPAPAELFESRILAFLNESDRQRLLSSGSVDLAYDMDDMRFRLNIYKQESGISLAARVVPRQIPSFAELHLPPIVSKIAEYEQGLILVSGITGSGKSTTIAAMLEQINNTQAKHIITIEEPIEFLYTSKKCLINQREVGINVSDYPTRSGRWCGRTQRRANRRDARRRDVSRGDASRRHGPSGFWNHPRRRCARRPSAAF